MSYWTKSEVPDGVCALPTEAWIATAPVGRLAGSWMVIWYTPASPVVSTELTTCACTPPTVTTGSAAVAGAPLTSTPAGDGGVVGPKPVAHSTSV